MSLNRSINLGGGASPHPLISTDYMKEKEDKQLRKQRAKNGEKTSKMMSFRADELTLQILAKVQNKGRLINDLVKQWWRRNPSVTLDDDIDPSENDIEEYFT